MPYELLYQHIKLKWDGQNYHTVYIFKKNTDNGYKVV